MKMFKKSLFLVLTLFMAVVTLASCGGNIQKELEEAAKKVILTQDKQKDVTGNFEVTSVVKVGENEYKVDWESSADVAKIGALNEDTKLYPVEIDYVHNNESDTDVKLTATLSKEGKKDTYSKEFNFTVPQFVVNTIEEYDAANAKTPMTIHGIVTAKEEYSASYKNTSVYVESIDGKGGVYAYRLACTQDQYDKELVIGARIYVSGNKTVYNGLREFDGGCTYKLETTETKTPKDSDVTSLITSGTGVSLDYQNQLVHFNNLEVVAVEEKDSKGRYNVIVGDAEDAKKQFVVRVNTYLTAKDSEAYKAYEALNLQPGMKISVKGVCGWSNGAQVYPLDKDSITIGEINYGKILANALWTQVNVPAQVYGEKEFILGTSVADLAADTLTGEEYNGLAVTWSLPTEATNVQLGTKTIPASGTEGQEDYVPAKEVVTLTTTTVTEDKTIALTATVKKNEETVATVTFNLNLVKEIIANTHAEYVAAAKKDPLVVKGVVTAIRSNLKEIYIQDADGAYLLYFNNAISKDQLSGEGWCQIGNEVAVKGVKDIYSDKLEVAKPEILEITSTGKTVTPVDKTSDFTTNGFTALEAADQGKLVTFTGKAKSTSIVTVGEKEVAVYFSDCTAPAYYAEGVDVKITGVLGFKKDGDNFTYQVIILDSYNVDDLSKTDEQKAEFVVAEIKKQIGTETFAQDTDIVLDKIYGNAVISVTGTDDVVTFDAATNTLSMHPTGTDTTTNLTISVDVNGTSKSDTVAVRTYFDPSNLSATLAFSGSSAVEIKNNQDFDESLLGLDSNVFTITNNNATKNAKLNTGSGGYIRLWNEKAATGNGSEFTISIKAPEGYTAATIKSIKIIYATGKYAAKAGDYKVTGKNGDTTTSETTVAATDYKTATDGTYTFENTTSVTIKNISTSTETQDFDIKSIEIIYSLTPAA